MAGQVELHNHFTVLAYRPAKLYAFCVAGTHFDLKVPWLDLSLCKNLVMPLSTRSTQISQQQKEKGFDQ